MADIGAPFLAAGAALGGKILWDWLTGGRKHNGSGDKPPEYWQMEFREAVREVLEERAPLMGARAEAIAVKVESATRTGDANNELLRKILEILQRRR